MVLLWHHSEEPFSVPDGAFMFLSEVSIDYNYILKEALTSANCWPMRSTVLVFRFIHYILIMLCKHISVFFKMLS